MPSNFKQTTSDFLALTLATVSSITVSILIACPNGDTAPEKSPATVATPVPQNLTVSSPDIANGQSIAKKFTADGANLSPAINWSAPPNKTASFALIADDPDAPGGDWIHWVVYDIQASEKGLPANVSNEEVLPNHASQGKNSFRKTGYGGPQPPPGKLHHYYFTVYALDSRGLPKGLDASGLLKSMQGHILAAGRLMGTYKR
jgi:Raf kinase inhibitor-like YbhB/YbcL family protein